MFGKQNNKLLLALGILVVFSTPTFAEMELPVIEASFGITPVSATSAFAIWVPLDSGEAVSGVYWYNNDGYIVFPEFLAVAGEYGHPELLANATPVGQNISGVSGGWSYHEFTQGIASESSGLYLLIQLPEGSDFVYNGLGGGAGIGFLEGDSTTNNCWITGDGVDWSPLDASYQMAIFPEMSANKSANILVLSQPDGTEQPVENREQPVENQEQHSESLVLGLNAAPNPFNPETTISFTLPTAGMADLSIFDLRGRLVRNLLHDSLAEGRHSVTWNGKDTRGHSSASGVYFVKMSSGSLRLTSRITLVQ